MKILETDRLILRAWSLEDAEDLYEYAKDDRVGPSAGWSVHKDIEESKKVVQMFIDNGDVYAIYHKKDNKIIGSFGVHDACPDKNLKGLRQKEIGYVLNPSYWGQGLVPEAVNTVINYLFNEVGLELIWCGHFDFNDKSKRVNEKCGFEYRFSRERILPLLNNKKVTSLYYSQFKDK